MSGGRGERFARLRGGSEGVEAGEETNPLSRRTCPRKSVSPAAPLLPASPVTVPVVDRVPSELVVARDRGGADPLIRLFVDTVAGAYGTPVNDGRVGSLIRGL